MNKKHLTASLLVALFCCLPCVGQKKGTDYAIEKKQVDESAVTSKEVGQASLSYIQSKNEIHVITQALQVYGDLDNGLLLSPMFGVEGKKVVEPSSVEFTFTSYSDKKLFTVNRKFVIKADEKILFSGMPTLTLSIVTESGIATETMKQRFPYKVFKQMLEAKNLELQLGIKTFELTPEHLTPLRDMKRCVDDEVSF